MKKTHFLFSLIFLLLLSAPCFAQDYIDFVKRTYFHSEKYTIEQMVDAISYGTPQWRQSGNKVYVRLFMITEGTRENAKEVEVTFSVNSGKVKDESIYYLKTGKTRKFNAFFNLKNASKNISRLIERKSEIAKIIQEVNEYVVYGVRGDVNGDGVANCQDFSFMFKQLWDKYHPNEKADCEIVANRNSEIDFYHAFVRVRIPIGWDLWEYIEPQAKVGSFEMPDAWDFRYDEKYNKYGDNLPGMTYSKNWNTTKKSSSSQFSKYGSAMNGYIGLGAELDNSKLGFHGDVGYYVQTAWALSQVYADLSYRNYDDINPLFGIDLGLRLGAGLPIGSVMLGAFGGFEIGWAFPKNESKPIFNCAPQAGVAIIFKKFLIEAHYTFDIGNHRDGAFCFGVDWMF